MNISELRQSMFKLYMYHKRVERVFSVHYYLKQFANHLPSMKIMEIKRQ